MSNDQKIMDKFVEQTQEILVLKASNRVLNSEIQSLKAENLRLLDESMVQEALKETAEKNLAHCSFVGDRLLEMQNAAIDLAQKVTELESKLKIAVEALKFYASDSSWNSVGAFFYNRIDSIDESTVDGLDKHTYFGGNNARKVLKEIGSFVNKPIKEIEGSIEKI